MQGQEKAHTLLPLLHSIYWQHQVVSRSSDPVLFSSTYFCSSSSQCPLEGFVYKQEKCLFSAYPWILVYRRHLPQSKTTMKQYFALIQGLGGGILPHSADEWGRETCVDLVKVQLKVTHLGYRH